MRISRLLLPLLLVSPTLYASDEATRWLERMSESAHKLNYVGTFVYLQGDAMETMRLVHAADDAGEHERLVSLSGPAREVIRDHGKVTCFLPQESSLVVAQGIHPPSFPITLPSQLERLEAHYRLEVSEPSRVAGVDAQHVAIVPRDAFRYGQNMWLSQDHALLLRADVVNERNEVVEQMEFTSLELMEKIPPELLQPMSNSHAVEATEHADAMEGEAGESVPSRWHAATLPPGFVQEHTRHLQLNGNSTPVEQMVFSDGLASVSAFIEERQAGQDGFVGTSRRGSVNAFGRLLPAHRITVVGEVPPETVRLIAEAIAPVGE